MKIRNITLYNIGPYADLNMFDISLSREKNIVLIGGKNGAGKTTFFKAIKTCLYGSKVWGFDAPGKEYYALIAGLVNNKTTYNNSASAYIEVELIFDDGKQVNSYILHREWRKIKQTFSEYFHIKKNGELIIGQDEDDFINYLLSVIPPDMFNFYFFDGESIADFFLGTDGNKNFRNAFLKLYGLDTISIMVDNFARNIKKSNINKSGYTAFVDARNCCERERIKCEQLKAELNDIESKIDLCQIQILSLQNNYSKGGGVSLTDWKELNAKLLKEENTRDAINRWLKEAANHYLPFIMMEKQLCRLSEELNLSQVQQRNEIILETFASDSFNKELNDYLKDSGNQAINVERLVEFLKKSLGVEQSELHFDFSTNQINRLLSQIYEKQEFDKKLIKKALTNLNASLKQSKNLRQQLMSSSVEGFEEFIGQKELLEKTISDLSIALTCKKQECEEQTLVYEEAKKTLEKAKAGYESILKDTSVRDISEKAASIFSSVEEKLVLRQAKLLQKEFTQCFNSIINKNNFIDGIVIDRNINVVPYKFITVSRLQLDNYKQANKEFLSLFDNVRFIIDMNKLELDEVQSIELPAPIKAPFSQGERQVYIMSIYLALLKTSRKDIPFFIDTPFARIDSEHRANIINEFFNKLDNQMFILSTDEEIIGEHKKMLESHISNVFTLQISNYGTTKISSGNYFGD